MTWGKRLARHLLGPALFPLVWQAVFVLCVFFLCFILIAVSSDDRECCCVHAVVFMLNICLAQSDIYFDVNPMFWVVISKLGQILLVLVILYIVE